MPILRKCVRPRHWHTWTQWPTCGRSNQCSWSSTTFESYEARTMPFQPNLAAGTIVDKFWKAFCGMEPTYEWGGFIGSMEPFLLNMMKYCIKQLINPYSEQFLITNFVIMCFFCTSKQLIEKINFANVTDIMHVLHNKRNISQVAQRYFIAKILFVIS